MSDNRKAGGYKAAINNPNVTEEGKQRAAEKLEELEHSRGRTEKSESHVVGGLKAALKNANVSQGAKEKAQHELERRGYDVETSG